MLSIKTCLVYNIFLNIVARIHTLVPLPVVEESTLVTTEKAIRNTVNSLFEAFEVHGIRNRPKIKQFSTIHNFLVSITLIDCDNLGEIARLSRVNIIDNSTRNFIAQINEVLNADDKSNEEYDNNLYVTTYIQKFIQKLKDLKEEHIMYKKNTVINAKILEYIDFDKNASETVTKYNMNSSEAQNKLEDYNKIFEEDDVWKPSGRRIYEGIRSTIKRYPFMASVHFFDKFQCAGSIIKNDLVITSASCLQIAWNNRFFRENPAFLSVRIGCDYYDFCGENLSVLEIYFYPQYNPNTLKHNIAIMRLNRKINFRRSHGRVKKIEVDKSPWAVPVTSSITLIGWGAKDRNNIVYDVFKNKLSYSKLDLFLLQDCQEHYSKEFVTDRNFCAGFLSKGGGACNRDAGGPGIRDNTLMGVVSFGSPICGDFASPTVFTKLGFYWEWIENIMDLETAFHEIRTTTRLPHIMLTFEEKTTTKEMKMYPFGDAPLSSVISEADALRIAQDQDFKDFLSTMFESEEINGYLDTSDTESKVRKLTNIDEIQKKYTNSPVDNDVEDDLSVEPAKKSQKAFTTLENVSNNDKTNDNESNNYEIVGDKEANYETKTTVDPKMVEKDIMPLIDNLDIDELLRSIKILENADKNGKTKEGDLAPKEVFSLNKNVTVLKNPRDEIITSSNQNPSHLNVDENGEGEEDGLSIEAEPFIALSLRDSRNSTDTTSNFVTLAIKEQVKEKSKKSKKRGYLL